MDLSIVVSTYNRASHLERLLDSLTEMDMPKGCEWELVLVDNNSTDRTPILAHSVAEKFSGKLRYFFEARQGKSFGLNKGLREAKGQILAFTDDDAIMRPDWGRSIVDFFAVNPDAHCVGGKVELFDTADAPTSIRLSEAANSFGLSEFSAVYIPIIGCNMAFRAEIARKVGDFDTDIGAGGRFGGAEDLDYLYRVVQLGYRLHYEPSIGVYHNHGRRTRPDLDRLIYDYFRGRGAFYCKHALAGDSYIYRLIWWEVRSYCGRKSLRAIFDSDARRELGQLCTLFWGGLRYLALHKSARLAGG